MSSLPFSNWDTRHAALSELSEIRDLTSLRVALVQTIARRLIEAEDGSFNQIDYLNKSVTWDSIRPLPGELERMEACSRHFDGNPLLQIHRRPDSPAVLRLSDVMPLRAFERNPVYQELYRPIGIKHHLLVRLGFGSRLKTIILQRSNRDFSNREIKLLDSIAPLAAMLTQVAEERELLRQALTVDEPGRGVILLEDGNDAIAWANALAQQQMSQFFPLVSKGNLPPQLMDRLSSPGAPLIINAGKSRLRITLIRNGAQRMLRCEELPAEPSPQALQKLGLTPRQAEVLFWISRGKTNSEIGIILSASVHTINRHVEAIFERLSVESRASAMVIALEALGT
jgi:DNA-binding CsgD family transcriptional regulator